MHIITCFSKGHNFELRSSSSSSSTAGTARYVYLYIYTYIYLPIRMNGEHNKHPSSSSSSLSSSSQSSFTQIELHCCCCQLACIAILVPVLRNHGLRSFSSRLVYSDEIGFALTSSSSSWLPPGTPQYLTEIIGKNGSLTFMCTRTSTYQQLNCKKSRPGYTLFAVFLTFCQSGKFELLLSLHPSSFRSFFWMVAVSNRSTYISYS